MLTDNQILAYAQTNTLTKNILTEYIQHEMVDSFFRQKNSEYFSFIGGTAIRICYDGARFSEDLDFDTTHLEYFDELITSVTNDMESRGFVLESRLIHKGAYHCHLKFIGLLKDLGLSGYSEEKLLIKVDATPIAKLYTANQVLNNYGIFQTVKVAPPDILLAKKLLTIMSRKRPKGRDLYDITYLWGLTDPNAEYLKVMGKTTLKKLLVELREFVSKIDLKSMVAEVSPFLTNPRDADRVHRFDTFIKSMIG